MTEYPRKESKLRKDYRDKKRLEALYARYSIREIGTLYNISGNAIWKWLKKFGIEAKVEDSQPLEMIQDLRYAGLSSENIALVTGVGVSQVYKIKKGDIKCPQSLTLRRLTKLHNKVCKDSKKTEANSIH